MSVFYRHARKEWVYEFQYNGKRYYGYCKDPDTGEFASKKSEAKAIEAKIKGRIITRGKECYTSSHDYTVAQAFAVYLSQASTGGHSNNQKIYVRELVKYFVPSTPVRMINDLKILEYIAWARKQKIKIWAGSQIKQQGPFPAGKTAADFWRESDKTRSDSTINRYLDALRKTLRITHKARNPDTGKPMLEHLPDVPTLKEPELLPRPISADNLEKLMAVAPQHLAEGIELSVLMGFRKAEVFGLTKDQVDFENRGIWLDAVNTKGYRDEFIPAGERAMELLTYMVERANKVGQNHLILYKTGGKKSEEKWRAIKNPQGAWQTALEKIGLTGKHVFHNTKASFVTAVANAMPDHVTQKMARHKDYKTTQRYILMLDTARREAIDAVEKKFIGINGANVIETMKSPSQKSQPMLGGGRLIAPNPLNKMVGTTGFEPATPSPPDLCATRLRHVPPVKKRVWYGFNGVKQPFKQCL